MDASKERSTFFGAFPQHGVWTALELGRRQFFAILGLSLLVFASAGGPIWAHVADGHTLRIAASYGVIPPAVWLARRRNGASGVLGVVVASMVLAAIKLVLTAGLLVLLALGRG